MKAIDRLIVQLDRYEEVRNRSCADSFEELGDDMLANIQSHMIKGLTCDGDIIQPRYVDNVKPGGWFKSAETAQAYLRWKRYNYGAPATEGANVFIDGTTYKAMKVKVDETYSEVCADNDMCRYDAEGNIKNIDSLNRYRVLRPDDEFVRSVLLPTIKRYLRKQLI